jgi:hypothetical protein
MTQTMTYRIAAIFILGSSLFAQRSALYPDVTVLASDAKGMTLEFRPQYQADRSVTADRSVYSVPRFMFEAPSVNNRPGSEDIRSRVIPVALPSAAGNSVTVTASDFETISGYMLAPVPDERFTDRSGSTARTYRAEYLSKGNFYPQQLAELGTIGSVKGIVVGNVLISPFQYQSSSRTLKRYSRIVVRIDYGNQDASIDLSGSDDWAKVSLLNYTAAEQWGRNTRFAKRTAASSVLSSGTWAKLEVTEDGIYKLDAAYLRSVGIDPVSRPIGDVKVFGAEGRRIPENLSSVRPADLPQMAVEYVDKNSNGTFDADDYLLFYGQGITGWIYDPVQKQFSHYGNPYTYSNYYFVSLGAAAPVKNIPTVSLSGGSGTLRTVMGKAFFEEDKFNFHQSGQEWASAPINPGESRTVTTKLTGWVPGTPVVYRYFVYGRSTEGTTMSIEESGQAVATASFAGVDFTGLTYHYYAWPDEGQASIVPALTDQRSMVKFKYNSTNNISTAYIGWLRMFYRMQLTAYGNQLPFTSPDTSGTVAFETDGFTRNDITVYEVSNFSSVRKMQYSLQQQAGSMIFRDTLSAGSPRRYYACTPDQFKTPKSAVKIPTSNLHGFAGAEFIIITHTEFKSEAVRLKQHKESLAGGRKLSTAVVEVDTVYNEFGLGMPDPVSIRDFLKFAAEQWTVKPKYVLFFGDASYDYRGIMKNDRSWVPTYETPESNIEIDSYANEDYFSYFTPGASTVGIAHGRLTPRSAADAAAIVDKIILYETGMVKGPWKNVVTVVADDMWTPQTTAESDHIQQSEIIASMSVNQGYDVKRIYMEEFATVFASTGRRKPAVREAILNQVNENGTLLLNFVGHGNPKVWAHESILTQDDVRNQFVNREKLTFIVAATCDWGRFEEAGESSSAEDVVLNRKGGSIGVLSANRAVYSAENALTNQKFYEYLMAGQPMMRLGDAYMLMKNALNSFWLTVNKQKYFLLGDPSMMLAAPGGSVVIDSLITSTGTPVDSMRALDKITMKATVRDTANAILTGFNGTALLTVNDAEYKQFVPPVPSVIPGDNYFSYRQNGAVIYSGQATAANGVITATFIVPKDISYTNKNGRVSIYFYNSGSDGRGSNKNFIVGGTNANAAADSLGPSITIYFDDPNFRSGDVVNEHPVLYVSLKDSNGINSSTHSIGHRLEAWIDGSTKSVDLTGYYQGKSDSYKEGSAAFALEGLSEGNHSIAVRAWDVYNNSSTAEAFFVVASSASLSIQQLFNIPNPVTTTTAFTFFHNQTVPIDVTINIYTVAGRLIQTIERAAVPERFVKIDWNRRDRDGDEVGNGLYFYKVIAKTIDGRFTSEAIGKMAVIR